MVKIGEYVAFAIQVGDDAKASKTKLDTKTSIIVELAAEVKALQDRLEQLEKKVGLK